MPNHLWERCLGHAIHDKKAALCFRQFDPCRKSLLPASPKLCFSVTVLGMLDMGKPQLGARLAKDGCEMVA